MASSSSSSTPVNLDVVQSLRAAVKDCSDRGLHFASKWASELLASTPSHLRRPHPTHSIPAPITIPSAPSRSTQPSWPRQPPSDDALPRTAAPVSMPESAQTDWDADGEEDVLSEGTACFIAREFTRAAFILRRARSPRGRFLRIYTQYLASEKKAIQNWNKLDGTRRQPPSPVNGALLDLYDAASADADAASDPWLLFLRGLLLHRLGRRPEAIELCIRSIGSYAWNWSAWVLLSDMVDDAEELSALFPLVPLPQTHPLVMFFQVRTLNALHQPTENELGLCDRLLGPDAFPGSLWLMSLRACVLYHLHDFGQAEVQFERILELDPFRVDDLDIYSNILYVTENRLKLSKLAHQLISLDRDRPEVCCLIGNHYSLRAEHEKAVRYFRRATDLDRTYLSAWTLMGHEYVEMKNSHAAIEAYRRAVDVNRKDYRAWYGLGQAYELLSMHQYALYYYQHATALRPYDVRLWQAQGASYEEMGRLREAVECYRRALLGADANEVPIDLKIAKLLDDLGKHADAATFHRRVLDLSLAALKPIAEYASSAIYLARFHLERDPARSESDLALAQQLMDKVAGSNSGDADEAAELGRRIHAELEDGEGGGGGGVRGGGMEEVAGGAVGSMRFVH